MREFGVSFRDENNRKLKTHRNNGKSNTNYFVPMADKTKASEKKRDEKKKMDFSFLVCFVGRKDQITIAEY